MGMNRYWEQARTMLRSAGAVVVSAALAASLMLSGCATASAESSSTAASSGTISVQTQEASLSTDWRDPAATSIDISGMDFEYGKTESSGDWSADGATSIILGDTITTSGDGATVDGTTVTITAAGTYVISGSSSNVQIKVNAGDNDKVQIVLNGASVTNQSGPALFVENADKVYVTLTEGTENTLADTADNTATYGEGDSAETLNAAVYSKADICFNGAGTLTVSGNSAHAIKGKDDVVLTGGTYHLTAVQDGIRGKDSVKITGATIDITAGSDGIQTSNTTDADKGFISIDGGTLSITAGDDGIQASRYLRITGGSINVNAGDDALHSDIDGLISGGDVVLQAGDDAFHTEYNLGISGGTVDVQQSYEGLEGQTIVVADGTLNIVATDDAFNASQGSEEQDTGDDSENATASTTTNATAQQAAMDPSAGDATAQDAQATQSTTGQQSQAANGQQGQMPQQGRAATGQQGQMPQDMQNAQGGGMTAMGGAMMEDDGVSLLAIEGGTITISAGGDGLDSNGDLLMTGGTVYLSGPDNTGNGSLDYGGEGVITGGTIVTAGAAGMALDFSSNSTQPSILANASGSAGDVISIVDENGAELASYTVTKNYGVVLASAPGMTEGATYKVLVNGTEAASAQATTQQQAAGMGGGMGDRGDMMGGMRGQDGMGPRAGGQGMGGMQQQAQTQDTAQA